METQSGESEGALGLAWLREGQIRSDYHRRVDNLPRSRSDRDRSSLSEVYDLSVVLSTMNYVFDGIIWDFLTFFGVETRNHPHR